jgi:hypothetical protein
MESSLFMTTNRVSPDVDSPTPIGFLEEAHDGMSHGSPSPKRHAEVVPRFQQEPPVPKIVDTFSYLKSASLILLLLKSLMIKNLSSCEMSSSMGVLNFATFRKDPSENPLMPFTFPMTSQTSEKAAVVLPLSLKSLCSVASASTIP